MSLVSASTDSVEVSVTCLLTSTASGEHLGAARAILSPAERARADRFVHEDDRRDFTLAHALLRETLSCGSAQGPDTWVVGSDTNGKPTIEGAGCAARSCSLSHTRGLVACAVTAGAPVGVDVERTSRVADATALARRFFSADEHAALARLDGERCRVRFVELWTLKEAFLKGVGLGMRLPLDAASFALERDGEIEGTLLAIAPRDSAEWQSGGRSAPGWHFLLYAPADDLRLALAVRSPSPPRVVVRQASLGLPVDAGPLLRPTRVSPLLVPR